MYISPYLLLTNAAFSYNGTCLGGGGGGIKWGNCSVSFLYYTLLCDVTFICRSNCGDVQHSLNVSYSTAF